jgi:hypothetical protein
MNQNNPLMKFFRQPKIYINLPSRGLYYEQGVLSGNYEQVPIFAMTGMDEIISKTPDALFSGEATARIIESCCPVIKNAKLVPSIDLDTLMVSIRIATFGNKMNFTQTCKNCGTENDYESDLGSIIDHFQNLKYVNSISINDTLTVKIRPLQYEEMNHFSIENFKLQRMLYQTTELADTEKQKVIDKIYQDLSDLQLQLFLTSIESIQTPDAQVTQKEFIEEYLRNCEREIYNQIKNKLEENKEIWSMPKQHVKCASCGTEDHIQIVLDQSNFFA